VAMGPNTARLSRNSVDGLKLEAEGSRYRCRDRGSFLAFLGSFLCLVPTTAYWLSLGLLAFHLLVPVAAYKLSWLIASLSMSVCSRLFPCLVPTAAYRFSLGLLAFHLLVLLPHTGYLLAKCFPLAKCLLSCG